MSKRPQRIGTYLNIGVIGGSQPELKYAEIAYDVGKLLALKGAVLICGGLSGIMASAAKGAYEAGGITVGILPGLSAGEGNEFLSVRIPTGIGYARNFLIVRASDALVAIDGSNGTISEASFAIAEGKTVVSIDSTELRKEKDGEGDFVKAESAVEAVEKAVKAAADHRQKANKLPPYD